MEITLTGEVERFVRDRVETGAYASEREMVEAAVQLLRYRDERLEELRREIQVGLDQLESGKARAYSEEGLRTLAAEIKAKTRRRLEENADAA